MREGEIILCNKVNLNMCSNQSTFHGLSGRQCLLMAAAAVTAVIFISIIIIASVSGLKEDGCMGELQCLPIPKCEGHINPDFIYGCGEHGSPKICCIAKQNDTKEVDKEKKRLSVRLEKTNLLPKKCGIGPTDNKIANGVNATLGEFPWMVILGYTVSSLPFVQKLCGGTIINNRYVLTAAHCTSIPGLTLSLATLGEHNLETVRDCEQYEDVEVCSDDPVTIPIEKIIVHPKFNRSSLKNDIALLRLQKNITEFTDFIKPICLPFGLKINEKYFLSKNFTISGWGTTSASSIGASSVLQHTMVQPWETDKCNEALKPPFRPVEDRQVCATGRNYQEACRGDSGGPMTYYHVQGINIRSTQLGIVSFKSFDSCGTNDVPTVFTRVDRYLDWILDNLDP